jgi:HEAT repeat protein
MNTSSPANPHAVDELLSALAFDASSSVRLNAVEALYRHADQSPVRNAIASALPRESSPVVQLAMIDLLAATRDPVAASALEKFSANESQGEAVRDAARYALAQM